MKPIESTLVCSFLALFWPLPSLAAQQAVAQKVWNRNSPAKIQLHPAVSKRNDLKKDSKGYYYIVKKDDFLGYIATRFYGTKNAAEKIMQWNNIKNPNHIWVGRKLRLKEKPLNVDENKGRKEVLRAHGRKFGLKKNWYENYYKKPYKVNKNKGSANSKDTIYVRRNTKNKSLSVPFAKSNIPAAAQASVSLAAPAAEAAAEAAAAAALAPTLALEEALVEITLPWSVVFAQSDAKLLLTVGDRLFTDGKAEEAFWFLRSARKREPKLGKAWALEMMIASICGWKNTLSVTKSALNSETSMNVTAPNIIQAATKAQSTKTCIPKLATLGTLSSKEALAFGEGLGGEGKDSEALAFFREARSQEKTLLRAWILEIKTLRKLGKTDEESVAAKEFVEANPQLANLPFLRKR